MKRWSKLQTALYNIMDRSDNFQIHCVAYRMPKSRSHNPQIPRYWITVGKGKEQKIIFDYPSQFEHNGWFVKHIENISDLIREYIDTPRAELKDKQFEHDYYGLTDILKSYDRRL